MIRFLKEKQRQKGWLAIVMAKSVKLAFANQFQLDQAYD